MAKVEIRKILRPSSNKMSMSDDYEFFIDGKPLNEVVKKVKGIHIDMEAREIPKLIIEAHIDELEVEGDFDIDFDVTKDGTVVTNG